VSIIIIIIIIIIHSLFAVRHNARIASAVLAVAIPSFRLSVTRQYCVKMTAHSMVQFA